MVVSYYILVVSVSYVWRSILYMVEKHTGLRIALNVSGHFNIFTWDTHDHLVQTSYLVEDITKVQKSKTS